MMYASDWIFHRTIAVIACAPSYVPIDLTAVAATVVFAVAFQGLMGRYPLLSLIA